MKTCQHCGIKCKALVPVVVSGKVALVGPTCAKKFKRAKRSDLFRSVATRTIPTSDQPEQAAEAEFHNYLSGKVHSTKNKFTDIEEWYIFKGYGIAVHVHTLLFPQLRAYNSWPYTGLVKANVYDPYTGKVATVSLEYKNNPQLGDTVGQEFNKGESGYSQVLQDFIDIYYKWDPIDKHVPGSARKGPGLTPDEATSLLLANKWTDQDPTGYWISEKLDGVRAIWDGKNLISRLGNKFHAPQWFKDELPKNTKLDGELFVGRGQFSETVSIVKSHDDKGWSKITYRVFDLPNSKEKFERRQSLLKDVVKSAKSRHLKYVKQIKCKNKLHLDKVVKDMLKLGAEGAMLREPGSIYEPRRSSTLLKVKKFHDAEGKVVGYERGTGRLSKLTGALVLERGSGSKKVRFKVGSGLTDSQRRNPPKIGSRVTFRYQEITARGMPRFPTFVSARDYE